MEKNEMTQIEDENLDLEEDDSNVDKSEENIPNIFEVVIENFAFSPQTITINRGDTVIWTNLDASPHTVTSDKGNLLDSELIQTGDTYSHNFDEIGTYSYYCSPHPEMKGKVVVL